MGWGQVTRMKKIVIASNNPGKVTEIGALLAPLEFEVIPQSSLGIPEAEEPHSTFVENALAKARHAAKRSGTPALADDSGLCVDALQGAPGVHSARFAGPSPRGATQQREEQDARNNEKLLELLDDKYDRRAHYFCVIVLMRSAQDPQPLICEAEWHGEIALTPRGSNGFGYDPLFLIPELGKTGAELPLEYKNRISHRGKALAALVARLSAVRSEA